ncbi:MAG TPA: type II toxin-antitoxin system MqsA family antitoxin [Tepidiformaceae bacterium]|nr:type II toxin-antitoxin system MqsA family antitoxin [Tepidiformaceae bacterium]
MTCVICKAGATSPGTTTVTLERGGTVVIIRDVPAQVCEDCGEYYLDEPVAQWVYSRAEQAVGRRVEVEILRYAA